MSKNNMKASEEFVVGKHSIGWIDSDFTREYEKDEFAVGEILPFKKLERYMYDSEIIKEFNIQDSTLGDVLALLDNATAEQKDGYSNIFYIAGHSHVVDVGWHDGEWGVLAWQRDGLAWVGGGRVFSPATDAKKISTEDSDPLTLKKFIEDIENVIKKYK